jgi:predicted AlkP superfamily phosphohydrolase/phosphomutase
VADGVRVLAVMLEAAEPEVVRRMIAAGELPALARLAERSAWLPVAADPYVGSVTLVPSFLTGLPPERHGRLYGPWLWDPESMRVAAQTPEPLVPLWTGSAARSVGLFDVPLAPASPPDAGFVVRGWGAHNPLEHEYTVWPPEAEPLLGERHPFKFATEINYKSGDRTTETGGVSRDAQHGIRLRGAAAQRLLRRFQPEVAIVDFPELHRTGHWLWHTLDPAHELFANVPDEARSVPVDLGELYREVDRQVGMLVEDNPGAEVFVMALHGMKPAAGIVDLLRPVLIATGWSAIAKVRAESLPRRALSAVKARTPASVKRAYYAALPDELTLRLANLLPDYDWAATRAFAIPSEQHGWIRLNVAGREAEGIVAPGSYESTCDELEEMLRSLTSPAGDPLVHDVERTGGESSVPDLVVQWTAAAHAERARLGELEVHAPRIVPWLTGEHTTVGFCLAPPERARGGENVAPVDLMALVLAAVA